MLVKAAVIHWRQKENSTAAHNSSKEMWDQDRMNAQANIDRSSSGQSLSQSQHAHLGTGGVPDRGTDDTDDTGNDRPLTWVKWQLILRAYRNAQIVPIRIDFAIRYPVQ